MVEVVKEYVDKIHDANIRWLIRGSLLKAFFDFLNEIYHFWKRTNIEELNEKGWMTNLAFLIDVTGHLDNLNNELKIKMFLTEMYDDIKAFKCKLMLSENQSKLHNLFHFSHSDT